MNAFKPQKSDIETLELFAYNRLQVRHYDEAQRIYSLLRTFAPDRINWALAEALCFVRMNDFDNAVKALQNVQGACSKAQNFLKERIQLYAAAHASATKH